MSFISINFFIHAANILVLLAYSARDILWLRLFAIAASLIAMPYFILQPRPLWPSVAWGSVFIVINTFRSWRLMIERRPVKLTVEEQQVQLLMFRNLPPRKVLQIVSIGTWINSQPGDHLIERGKPVRSIFLVLSGKVEVSQEGQVLGFLKAGDLVGSALLLSGAVAEVDAITREEAQLLRWELGTLERFINADPETRHALRRHLARDLAGKLHRLGEEILENQTAH
jgi:hypothetical protein